MSSTSKSYVLIDFENIQPNDYRCIVSSEFHIIVFLGPQQPRIPVSQVKELQPLGARVTYEIVSSSGKNAVDMQIAYEIGRLAQLQPKARFHIVSKDRDYDSLIQNLKAKNVIVFRRESIEQILLPPAPSNPPSTKPGAKAGPKAKTEKATVSDELVLETIAKLKRKGISKPVKASTLASTLQHMHRKLCNEDIVAIIQRLKQLKHISIEGTKVIYRSATFTL